MLYPKLAAFLVAHPIAARRAARLLRAHRTAASQTLADAIEGIHGCGALRVGAWTLTPDPAGAGTGVALVSPTTRAFACHRIGIIVLDTQDAATAVPLASARLRHQAKTAPVPREPCPGHRNTPAHLSTGDAGVLPRPPGQHLEA